MSLSSSLRALGLLACGLALAGAAQAHRSFLVPSSTILSGSNKQWVTVDAARGNDLFYFNHNALTTDGLVITAPDGATVPPAKLERFRYRTVFDWEITQPGTWRAAVVDDGYRVSWEEGGQGKRWTGPVSAFASAVPADAQKLNVAKVQSRVETFVTSGKPTTPARIDSGMEVVYQPHPNDLLEGEATVLTFLIDGQPASGLSVNVVQGGGRYRSALNEQKLTTDAAGQVRVTWSAPGLYWISAAKRLDKPQPPATRASVSYAATVEVMGR
jgi:uncharacterized GH25 family protein